MKKYRGKSEGTNKRRRKKEKGRKKKEEGRRKKEERRNGGNMEEYRRIGEMERI